MTAHIRKPDLKRQSIKEHCEATAELCERSAGFIHLSKLAHLIGLIHDMGKYTEKFNGYLETQVGIRAGFAHRGDVRHSPVGAIFAFERWYEGSDEQRCTAQIVSMVILAHHSGFTDILDMNDESPFDRALKQDKNSICYDEAVDNFLNNVTDVGTLDALFYEATDEFTAVMESITFDDKKFYIGLIAREMLSVLVDSDRWDSACFEYNENPFEVSAAADWKIALDALESHISGIGEGKLSPIRGEISSSCEKAAEADGRIFRLTVPTGGGKTFASLRFALKYASQNLVERIFYIIPFNTILDQNANDMRRALKETLRILEHHSNVVSEIKEGGETENYRLLTERWTGSDLILTSMVQFLNCVYRCENTNARRMCRLSNSVLIFDEIQALPKKCTVLFERIIDFLTAVCGCTVVLCTATQPDLTFQREPIEMYTETQSLFETLRRTEIINEAKVAIDTKCAADLAERLVQTHGSVLMIVNTKKMAKAMYAEMKKRGVPSLHLSTSMYPAHRMKIIDDIRNRDEKKQLFCVSTALIEAGINISFPCVIRSLAGIGSIIQAAGRCNRNSELPDGVLGKVYVWKLAEEYLSNLEEIETAQNITYGVMESYGSGIDTVDGISEYFKREKKAFADRLRYPLKLGDRSSQNLVDLLGAHKNAVNKEQSKNYILRGAYRTAGESFNVIEQNTKSVLIPIGRGEEIYHALCGALPMKERIALLREASGYSVTLYDNMFHALCDKGAVITLAEYGVFVLHREYYNSETGVTTEPMMPEYLEI